MSDNSILEHCDVEDDSDDDQLEQALKNLHSLAPVSTSRATTTLTPAVTLSVMVSKGPKLEVTKSTAFPLATHPRIAVSSEINGDSFTSRIASESMNRLKICNIPTKVHLTPTVPRHCGDSNSPTNYCAASSYDQNMLQIEDKKTSPTSGIREEFDYLTVAKAKPVNLSAVSWDRFIVSSSYEAGIKIHEKSSDITPPSPSRNHSDQNAKERFGTGPLLDTNIDCEELLKNNPEFNKYYEERVALQRKNSQKSEKRTALHAALGMPFAAKVSRSDLRSFEKFQ